GSGMSGSGRQGQDLSALFDKELQRQQRTNYETKTPIEQRPQRPNSARPGEASRRLEQASARARECRAHARRDEAPARTADARAGRTASAGGRTDQEEGR